MKIKKVKQIPTFSIIVPAYNAEKHIERCILSVVNQTLQDFEIISVNDGSSDSTEDILDKLAILDSRIKVIHQTNQGPLIARQTGISAAKGEYILFLDSDDYYDSVLLETVNRYSKQGYDMILFRWHYRKSRSHSRDSKTIFAHEAVFTKDSKKIIYAKLIESHDLNMLWAKAVKRSLFTPQMFDANEYCGIKNGEDLLQVIPLLLNAASIINVDIPLYNYVKNDESITLNFNVSYFQSRKLVSNALEELLCQSGMTSEVTLAIIDRRFLSDVAFGIPTPAQIKKAGPAVVDQYLRSIACDKLFRSKYEAHGTKGIKTVDRAQLLLLYRYQFRWVRCFSWLQTPGRSIKYQIGCLWNKVRKV